MISASSTESAPLGIRVRVLLHRWRLDRGLADGRVRDRPADRAWRARQLSDPATRRELACSLRRVVAEADRPTVGVLNAVPVQRRAVARWREALLGIAELLERPLPVSAGGVARVAVLVSDGLGPLYNPRATRSLGDAVWWIADGLQPCETHAWESPTVCRHDRRQVQWTCRQCGALATTADPGVPPE
ncbi:MAG: hypothetical protein ABSH51_31885 [Solirubrobacteraceae bacterium]